jgi:hypothetical protein
MKILLLSQNHTVTNMITLALESIKNLNLDVVETIDNIKEKEYKWILVNDTFPLYIESLALAKKLGNPHTVILHQPGNAMIERFDHHIEKPFLPSEILEVVSPDNNQTESLDTKIDEEKKEKKKRKRKKKKFKSVETEPNILNLDEIETIKALLEEDGLEIVHEEELVETVLSEGTSEIKKKKKKNTNKELLKALKKMKPKRIRKLLKGAKVKIKISFQKDA